MQNDVQVSIWVNVNCPICTSIEARQVYSSAQETGDFLGRITVRLVVCEHCGFVYQNPQISESVLNDYYSTSTSASGSVYHDIDSNSIHSIKQRDRVHFFRKCLENLQNITGEPKLLEIGCSTGDFLVALKLEGWRLYGLEPSVVAATQAHRQGVIVINTSLQNSPATIETYDAVCAFSVLEHLPDLNRAFYQIHSKLKFGGLLCLEVPDSMRPAPQLAEFFGYEHLWHFTKNTLNNYLSKWGYCNIIYDQRIQDARLRVCAVKGHNGSEVIYNDKENILPVIEKYSSHRKDLIDSISDKLRNQVGIWKRENIKIAIYGAGIHTHYLFDAIDIYKDIDMILDSDPKKWGKRFMRWTVNNENAISEGLVDCIIISSKAYEGEIYNRLLPYVTTHGISVLRCYS